uniref:NADH dehydrogenase [ubiquinone] 1 beta subcomplex subunit 9 n=1 Tax=Piliocolobus tephrosceles TaxID=591936 RepID=A0A8C9LPZ9_9PRIM
MYTYVTNLHIVHMYPRTYSIIKKLKKKKKRALHHLELWSIQNDKYQYFAYLMRAWCEEHKNEKDMMKATQLLKEAEEVFWYCQHPQPYIFPDSPREESLICLLCDI